MDSLDPRYGGTVEAGRALTAGLIREGHDVEAVCLDGDQNSWHETWQCPVHKLGPPRTSFRYSPALGSWLKANADRFDALIVHNVYRYVGLGVWKVVAGRKPYYLFTHGMLDPWFKRAHPLKHLKKLLFWHLIGSRMFRDAAAVLYTCEEERVLARLSFPRYECVEEVVGLGISYPCPEGPVDGALFRAKFPRLKDAPYLLFLGRITRKKGIDNLIEGFAEVYKHDRDIFLVIAGTDQEGLQKGLEQLAGAKQLAHRLLWTGPLYGDLKWSAVAGAEAMALCSHTENFGITISEALALSLPVLVTDKVNIWREIAQNQSGFVESDDLEGAKRLLAKWRLTDSHTRNQMKINASETFWKHFEIGNSVRRLLDVLGNEPLEVSAK